MDTPRKVIYPRPMRKTHRFLFALVAIIVGLVILVPAAQSSGSAERERLDAASKVYSVVEAQYQVGTVTLDDLYLWSVRFMQADRAVHGDSAAAQAHSARMTALESVVQKRVQSGMAGRNEELAIHYYTAEARVWLASPPR